MWISLPLMWLKHGQPSVDLSVDCLTHQQSTAYVHNIDEVIWCHNCDCWWYNHVPSHISIPDLLWSCLRWENVYPELRNLFGQTTLAYKRANYRSIMPSPIRFAWPAQRQALPIVVQIKHRKTKKHTWNAQRFSTFLTIKYSTHLVLHFHKGRGLRRPIIKKNGHNQSSRCWDSLTFSPSYVSSSRITIFTIKQLKSIFSWAPLPGKSLRLSKPK